MARKKPERETIDTRGLPQGYDPHKFYEYSVNVRAGKATGVEGFLYQILPLSVIKSFAYAIDPFSLVKMGSGVVTPVTRKRTRVSTNVFSNAPRSASFSRVHNVLRDGVAYVPPIIENYTLGLNPPQSAFVKTIDDTTKKTRILGSDLGEFENLKINIVSPSRTTTYRYVDDTFYHPGGQRHYHSDDIQRWTYHSPAATIPWYIMKQHFDSERNVTLAAMQNNAIAMYKGILPTSRNYTLFRNIVELRDLPRTIEQLRRSVYHLRDLDVSLRSASKLRTKLTSLTTSLDDIPKEYLAYHFGWKQSFRDAMDLMLAPSKIARQIDLMIKRNGEASTYRTKRVIPSSDVVSYGFDYNVNDYRESYVSHELRVERSIELRMVVNATINFPKSNIPNFRKDEFIRKLGLAPSFTDLYNLVPWTWLVDWFTGFGNYLEVIENINGDKNLINWGMVTGVNRGQAVTRYNSKVVSFANVGTHPDWSVQSYPTENYSHQSMLDYSFQLRKDLATLTSVKSTAVPSSLSTYQQTILGALLALRLRS